MTQRQCTHAALTPGTRPTIDAATGELRLPITVYGIDEPIEMLDLVLSAPEVADLLDAVLPPVTA